MRRILALLFTASPFVAGTIAGVSARHDLRMLWMALAATAVARVVAGVVRTRQPAWPPAGGAALAFVAASAAAAAVAVWAGARAVFGVVAVAVVLAGCATAGALLGERPHSTA